MQQPFQQYLVAGDTWKWTVVLPDYSPAIYTLKYFFRGPSSLDAVAIPGPDSTSYKFSISGDPEADPTTANLAPGVYAWQMAIFDADGNRTELDRGQVEILPNIETAGAGTDQRSFAKQNMDACAAVVLQLNSRIEKSYSVMGTGGGGRQALLREREEALQQWAYWSHKYKCELIRDGVLPPSSNQVHAAFGDQSNPVLTRLWKNFPGAGA